MATVDKKAYIRCSKCGQFPGKFNTIRFLGSGGDYENAPCPVCRPEDSRKFWVAYHAG